MDKIKHWTYYLNEKSPLQIFYPTCGGGEECITACPFKDKIWELKPMNVSLFGFKQDIRYRPVITNPDACKQCFICINACPTGALVKTQDYPIKHPWLKLTWYSVKLFFKKKYGLKYTLNHKHLVAFLKNNFEKYRKIYGLNDSNPMVHHLPWAKDPDSTKQHISEIQNQNPKS
jgi:ferredoxin